MARGKAGQRKVWQVRLGSVRLGIVRLVSVRQVSTGEAWWSMVRCGTFWFVNAGWARRDYVRCALVR